MAVVTAFRFSLDRRAHIDVNAEINVLVRYSVWRGIERLAETYGEIRFIL